MSNPAPGATFALPTFAVAITVSPEYIRLPPPGLVDPMFGLTRSYLNLLVLPSKENGFKPPVRSSALRQPQSKTGVRLVNVASLRDYLRNQIEAQSTTATAAPPPPTIPDGPNTTVEFIRLPKGKGRDPLFGLSRSFLNQLILPCPQNNYHPPVRSHVLRRRGYRTGIRLISVDSLRDYIRAHEEPASSQSQAPAQEGQVVQTSPPSGD